MRIVVLPTLFAALLLTSACSRANQTTGQGTVPAASARVASQAKPFSVTAEGEAYSLHFAPDYLTFCDKRGGRSLRLLDARENRLDRNCAKIEEPNTACSGLVLDVAVRAPLSEPNEIVDVGGFSFPLKGRVHDCSADGKALAVATGSAVILIDTAKGTATEVSQLGGDRVTLGSGWIAWTDGSKVHVLPLN